MLIIAERSTATLNRISCILCDWLCWRYLSAYF